MKAEAAANLNGNANFQVRRVAGFETCAAGQCPIMERRNRFDHLIQCQIAHASAGLS